MKDTTSVTCVPQAVLSLLETYGKNLHFTKRNVLPLRNFMNEIFLHSLQFDLLFFRFIKYINAYRVYQQNYDQPEFLDPPQFLREYETQVRTFNYQRL